MKLEESTWPDVARLDRDRVLVLAPIAACEQHSRHLPTFTDSVLCGSIAAAVEKNLRDEVLLLPNLWLGASDHHFAFGATLSVSVDTHTRLLEELLAPILEDGFRRVLILNGHGGNIDTLHVALRRLQPRYPDRLLTGASYWELASGELSQLANGPRKEMGHACEFETSMMLHFRPDLVRVKEIRDDHRPGNTALRGLFRPLDMGRDTDGGAVGFPTRASAKSGKQFADAAITRVTAVCRALLAEKISAGGQRRWKKESKGKARR